MGSKKKEQRAESELESQAQANAHLDELARVIKGWRHLASDVRIDGERVALLLGEAAGRLVFVHHLIGSKEEVVRGALRFVSQAEIDARRLTGQFSLDEAATPLVVVITEGKTQGLVKQMSALCPEPLLLLAERRLTSAEGNVRFLEVLSPQGVGRAALAESEPALQTLRPQLSKELEEVVARVDRIDPELQRDRSGDEVRWSWSGEALCSIERVGRIGEEGVPHDLSPDQSVEIFLDWVLARHLELFESVEGDGLKDVELMPHSSEPLLTPEEIAAFQE
jgi:hypothetical protein